MPDQIAVDVNTWYNTEHTDAVLEIRGINLFTYMLSLMRQIINWCAVLITDCTVIIVFVNIDIGVQYALVIGWLIFYIIIFFISRILY